MSIVSKRQLNAIEEALDQVTQLSRHYALWWYLRKKSNVALYRNVLMRYPEVFVTIADSLLESYCVGIYRLFDKRGDVISLIRLLEGLKKQNPAVARQLQKKIDTALDSLEKVRLLRHKIFGHRDRLLSPQDVFARVKLKPEEMQSLVDLAKEIVCALAMTEAKADSKKMLEHHETAVECDAHNLMQMLKKHTQ